MSLLLLLNQSSYTFATSPLALAFNSGVYKEAGTSYALTALPGYSYARTGQVSFVNASGTVTDFAANVAPVLSSVGYGAYEALTNYLLQSQAFDNASFSPGGSLTVSADQVVAPDGTTTADSLNEWVGSSLGWVGQSYTLGSASAFTFSVFAKASGGNAQWLQVILDHAGGAGSGAICNFDVKNGVVGTATGCSGYIIPCWSGGYRCVVTATATVGLASSFLALVGSSSAGRTASYTGAGGKVYVWQGQSLLGTFTDGGPIIATTTATASIGAEALSVSLANGSYGATYRFDDGTTQNVNKTASGGAVTLDTYPSVLNQPTVQSVVFTAASVSAAAMSASGTAVVADVGRGIETAVLSTSGAAATSLAGVEIATGALAAAGAAAVAATGQSTASAALAGTGATSVSGAGQTTAQASIVATVSAAFSAAGAYYVTGALSVAEAGTFAVTGRAIETATFAPAAAGSLATAGNGVETAALAGSGSASPALTGASTATAAFSPVGGVALAGAGQSIRTAALSAAGAATDGSTAVGIAAAVMAASAGASLTAGGGMVIATAVSAAGSGSLSAIGAGQATAALNTVGACVFAPSALGIASAAITAAASASASVSGAMLATGSLSGSAAAVSAATGSSVVAGALTAGSTPAFTIGAASVATGALSASGAVVFALAGGSGGFTAATLTAAGLGALSVSGAIIAAASMSAGGSGAVASSGGMVEGAALSASAAGVAANDGGMIRSSALEADGTAEFSPAPSVYVTGAAIAVGFGVLVGAGQSIAEAECSSAGHGAFDVYGHLVGAVPPSRQVHGELTGRTADGLLAARSTGGQLTPRTAGERLSEPRTAGSDLQPRRATG